MTPPSDVHGDYPASTLTSSHLCHLSRSKRDRSIAAQCLPAEGQRNVPRPTPAHRGIGTVAAGQPAQDLILRNQFRIQRIDQCEIVNHRDRSILYYPCVSAP